MTDRPKLSVIPQSLGPWQDGSDESARETLSIILDDYDRVLVLGVRRAPDERGTETETLLFTGQRMLTRTSLYELTGALHHLARDVEDDGHGDET